VGLRNQTEAEEINRLLVRSLPIQWRRLSQKSGSNISPALDSLCAENKIKQTCALPLFCDRDLEINSMTLKLEGDLDILKLYPHTENEAASLRHSEIKA